MKILDKITYYKKRDDEGIHVSDVSNDYYKSSVRTLAKIIKELDVAHLDLTLEFTGNTDGSSPFKLKVSGDEQDFEIFKTIVNSKFGEGDLLNLI